MVDEVRMFPRWFYKAGAPPRLCASEEEAQGLGEGWSDEGPAPPSAPEDDSDASESPRRRR
jgi:hypothetical protein